MKFGTFGSSGKLKPRPKAHEAPAASTPLDGTSYKALLVGGYTNVMHKMSAHLLADYGIEIVAHREMERNGASVAVPPKIELVILLSDLGGAAAAFAKPAAAKAGVPFVALTQHRATWRERLALLGYATPPPWRKDPKGGDTEMPPSSAREAFTRPTYAEPDEPEIHDEEEAADGVAYAPRPSFLLDEASPEPILVPPSDTTPEGAPGPTKRFADALKEARIAARLSQQQLSELLPGARQADVSRWERGSQGPHQEHYDQILDLLPSLRKVPPPASASRPKYARVETPAPTPPAPPAPTPPTPPAAPTPPAPPAAPDPVSAYSEALARCATLKTAARDAQAAAREAEAAAQAADKAFHEAVAQVKALQAAAIEELTS